MDGIGDNYKPIVYTKKKEDEDISKNFIKHVRQLSHMNYRRYYLNPKPLKLTSKEEKDFQLAKVCHICEQELNVDEETGQILKVRDHCHFTGEYRGAAHSDCNLKCRKPLILPVIFHNLQNYHWTKKRIYLYSKFKVNVSQMPHLLVFAQICRRTKDQICYTFAIMAMVVNAAFVSNLLPHAKAEIT